jgi:hypothetical protein
MHSALESVMRRCDYCGGKLGLIVHGKCRWRFCKLACKKAYAYRRREEMQRRGPWPAYLLRFAWCSLRDAG